MFVYADRQKLRNDYMIIIWTSTVLGGVPKEGRSMPYLNLTELFPSALIWAAAKTAYQSQGHAFRHYFLCYSRQTPPQNDVPRHQKSITRGFGMAPYGRMQTLLTKTVTASGVYIRVGACLSQAG